MRGATVRTATSAGEVLEVLRTWIPDVLLLDIGMPDMDGYELLSVIRHRPALRGIPAVAVTGYAHDEAGKNSTTAGFSGHVTKPFDVKTLFDLIRTVSPAVSRSRGVEGVEGDRASC